MAAKINNEIYGNPKTTLPIDRASFVLRRSKSLPDCRYFERMRTAYQRNIAAYEASLLKMSVYELD